MKVINISKTKLYDIYVGRGSIYGNPYKLTTGTIKDRNKVLDEYEPYVFSNLEILSNIKELRGLILGCHCAPLRCHADYLAKLANNSKFFYEEQIKYFGFIIFDF